MLTKIDEEIHYFIYETYLHHHRIIPQPFGILESYPNNNPAQCMICTCPNRHAPYPAVIRLRLRTAQQCFGILVRSRSLATNPFNQVNSTGIAGADPA
jgi:hypothetical protein